MRWIIAFLFAVFVTSPCLCQDPASGAADRPGILTTKQGSLAIDSPKGWSRVPDMGMAFFVPRGATFDTAPAWIYISTVPIGPKLDYHDVNSYIEHDVSVFKDKYPVALVEREIPVILPHAKLRAQIYTFQSGDKNNAYEQVVYVGEKDRVLMFNLSAKTADIFQQSLPVFRGFVISYRGSADTIPLTRKP